MYPVKKSTNMHFRSRLRVNQRLVTNELVEVEKQLVEVQDFWRIIDHFRGIYRIYLK